MQAQVYMYTYQTSKVYILNKQADQSTTWKETRIKFKK